jgi:hypothetical protein
MYGLKEVLYLLHKNVHFMFIVLNCTYCKLTDIWRRPVLPNCVACNPGVAGSVNKGKGDKGKGQGKFQPRVGHEVPEGLDGGGW